MRELMYVCMYVRACFVSHSNWLHDSRCLLPTLTPLLITLRMNIFQPSHNRNPSGASLKGLSIFNRRGKSGPSSASRDFDLPPSPPPKDPPRINRTSELDDLDILNISAYSDDDAVLVTPVRPKIQPKWKPASPDPVERARARQYAAQQAADEERAAVKEEECRQKCAAVRRQAEEAEVEAEARRRKEALEWELVSD